MRSRFVKRVKLTKSTALLETWLKENGYEPVDELYTGALPAIDLVSDFLDDYPELSQHQDTLEDHAEAIGYISDYNTEDISDDDVEDEEEY